MIISPMAWVSISGSAYLCAMNYRLSSRPSESNSPVDLLMKSKLDTFKIRGVGGEKAHINWAEEAIVQGSTS
jgi:hypothetical protein